jgi:hypothetical protein
MKEDAMRRKLVVAALCCLAVPIAAVLVPPCPVPGKDAPATPARELMENDGVDPTVEILLRERLKEGDDAPSPFFTALESLARRHNAKPGDYLPAVLGEFVRSGFAVRAGRGLVAVVLASQDCLVPGTDRQHLLLLDRDGRVRDRLCCEISNRCIAIAGSKFRTEEAGRGATDGACLIVRYTPAPGDSISEKSGGSVAHNIIHGGKTYSCSWDQKRPGAVKSEEWSTKGLCRTGVSGGKFVVLWPDLGAAER